MVSSVSSGSFSSQSTPQPTVQTVEARLVALKNQFDKLSDPTKVIDNSIELLSDLQSRIANTQSLLERLKNATS
jgi:hypothetical protein